MFTFPAGFYGAAGETGIVDLVADDATYTFVAVDAHCGFQFFADGSVGKHAGDGTVPATTPYGFDATWHTGYPDIDSGYEIKAVLDTARSGVVKYRRYNGGTDLGAYTLGTWLTLTGTVQLKFHSNDDNEHDNDVEIQIRKNGGAVLDTAIFTVHYNGEVA